MTSQPVPSSNSATAIALTIAAIFLFTLMDATGKTLAAEANTIVALWARYAGQMLLVTVLVAPRLRQVTRSKYLGLQFTRSVLLLMASVFFFFAFTQIPLASATAIMALNPMLITVGGALFLGEALGVRRITAIGIALVGALIIVRPGSEVFQPAAILAFFAALSFASYALITRRLGADEDVWTSLFYTGLFGAIIMSCVAPFYWPESFTPKALILMALISVFGTTGQLLLIRALSMAEAGLLAPFNYTGLAFAVFWGITLFQEWPDRYTVLGILVIAGAGLYVWVREMRLRGAPS